MIKAAKENNRILSIGHQRHYSMLYAHATEMIQAGLLGDIKHIRALWHRNFSWPWQRRTARQIVDGRPGHRPAGPDVPRRLVPADPARGLRGPEGQVAQVRLQEHRGADPLAAVQPHRRRPDGRARQPPARRGQHLPRQGEAAVGHGRRHPVVLRRRRRTRRPRNPRGIDDHVYVTFEFPGKNHPRGPNARAPTRTTWSSSPTRRSAPTASSRTASA